jgi:uncharacterized protein
MSSTPPSFPASAASNSTVEGPARHVAFSGSRRIAAGSLCEVAEAVWQHLHDQPHQAIVVINAATGHVVDLDLRGSRADTAARYASLHQFAGLSGDESAARRGRPKLGVVAREVTLLPRHWDWLSSQPGGASVALRKLVEAARTSEAGIQRERASHTYRFLSVVAGDLPGFEEAARALFASDHGRLSALMDGWPTDISQEAWRFLGYPAGPDSAD